MLHALAACNNGSYVPMTINSITASVEYGTRLLTGGYTPDVYCDSPYDASRNSFTVVNGLDLTTLDAASGIVLSEALLNSPTDNWYGSAYDSNGEFFAIGYPATDDGTQSIWKVNQTTARQEVVLSNFSVFNGLLFCVFAINDGKAFWLSNFPDFQEIVNVADLNTGRIISQNLYRGDGAILALHAITLIGSDATQLLALDIKGERGPLIATIDPSTGVPNVLVTFNATELDDDDGSLAYDSQTGMVYCILAVDSGTPGVVQRILHSIDITVSPPLITSQNLTLPNEIEGIYGLAVGIR